MDWGNANAEPQPLIAPSEGRKCREARGLVPSACPAWLCITSPDYSATCIPEKDKPELTAEQLAAIEKKKADRELAEEAKREANAIAAAEKKRRDREYRDSISRRRQLEREMLDAMKRGGVTPMAQTVREIRTSRKMSRPQFAIILGCSPQSIFNWETGRTEPSTSYLEKILAHENAMKETACPK